MLEQYYRMPLFRTFVARRTATACACQKAGIGGKVKTVTEYMPRRADKSTDKLSNGKHPCSPPYFSSRNYRYTVAGLAGPGLPLPFGYQLRVTLHNPASSSSPKSGVRIRGRYKCFGPPHRPDIQTRQ